MWGLRRGFKEMKYGHNVRTMPDLFRMEKTEWLESARAEAKKLLYYREPGVGITIEDVLAKCPRPSYLHRNLTGRVFISDDFVAIGFTMAKKASSKGRVIRVWELKA